MIPYTKLPYFKLLGCISSIDLIVALFAGNISLIEGKIFFLKRHILVIEGGGISRTIDLLWGGLAGFSLGRLIIGGPSGQLAGYEEHEIGHVPEHLILGKWYLPVVFANYIIQFKTAHRLKWIEKLTDAIAKYVTWEKIWSLR